MNCVKCGAELKDGAKFCKSCGAPQNATPGKCVKCGAELDADAKFCDACGAPQTAGQVVPQGAPLPLPPRPKLQLQPQKVQIGAMPPPGAPTALTLPPKRLVTYRMLALFLGGLGIHSFYAGDVVKGVIQLLLGWTGISGIWALIDIFKVTTDAYGRPMEDTVPKNRNTYQLLALFCGGIGAHNFYAGYLDRGIVQILLCWTGISWLWALVEMFVVKNDANGNPMVIPETKVTNKKSKVGLFFCIVSLVFSLLAILLFFAPYFTDFYTLKKLCFISVNGDKWWPSVYALAMIGLVSGVIALGCSVMISIVGILLSMAVFGLEFFTPVGADVYKHLQYKRLQYENRRQKLVRREYRPQFPENQPTTSRHEESTPALFPEKSASPFSR